MTEPGDPRDYLAALGFGLGPTSQPHVWETPRRSNTAGTLSYSCKFCGTPYGTSKAVEGCTQHPEGVARPGG
ncbi:MAG TPA: hypothetical protein VFH61_04770 [Thermoleophilia bacterium]|nr:hypothetical protein [Thermoleophilia bacterium]